MASEFVRKVLTERRKRAVGTIMGFAERRLYSKLTHADQEALREHVLSAIGGYHDVALDLLSASVDDGGMVNEEALRKLDQLHARVFGG